MCFRNGGDSFDEKMSKYNKCTAFCNKQYTPQSQFKFSACNKYFFSALY